MEHLRHIPARQHMELAHPIRPPSRRSSLAIARGTVPARVVPLAHIERETRPNSCLFPKIPRGRRRGLRLDLVQTPANRKRTLIAVIVGWFSQWSGVGVASYYLTLVLDTIGITKTKDQTLINGILKIFHWFVAIFLGAMLIDRLGRRTLFLASTAGMLVSYIAWTALTAHSVESGGAAIGRVVVGFIFINYFFYDIAWTLLLQAYTVEIFPYTLRGRGLSISYISAFVGLIVGNQVNPIAMNNIAWKYYILFCCLLAVLLVIIWILFLETKGRTLEEIVEIFEGPQSAEDGSKLERAEDEKMHVEHEEGEKKGPAI